ncbi:RecQ family ATP-dependent DNA helicase [Robertkochia sediminum]|uniref:RecQ family ATP-dependent DNA helicase n=1 Tax=Robertkochia sediminum TaxID=2785326 RepID=UPI001934A240|nr:ATP-dependent DNA helicase RecQ [Robertkochia sediminum]MBL7474170.1 RecQ family ATP-dependent DNA helicase [Robertkochia sediminum]
MRSKNPEEVLQTYWGYPSFREPQKQIIDHVLGGDDAMVLLPTGGGKSLCYQVPAMCKEGICVVISPLVALINDQVNQLKEKGIKALAITGGISPIELSDRLDNAIFGNYKFLYLSPERLQQELVLERLRQMPVNLIAVDEAHCISQWGNDFRPAYRECGILREILPEAPLIALTATATSRVTEDIKKNLDIEHSKTFSTDFRRPNLRYWIRECEDKYHECAKIFSKLKGSGIVYIRSRRKSVEFARELNARGIDATFFHGGLTAAEKKDKLAAWMQGEVRVMVATNAFGMGIDKADVQCVLHADLPDSIENYFQEAGRAGRDNSEAWAIMLYNKGDLETLENQFVRTIPDTAFITLLYKKLCNYLQIAYGGGSGEQFELNFNEFCNTYKLNHMLTYNGLQLLDRNSVLRLSEQFHKTKRVQFTVSNHKLFSYMDRNPSSEALIQLILRTYGGIFDIMTPVNTDLLAKRTGMEEKRISHWLEKFKADGIIELEVYNSDTSITFLCPREDQHTINSIARDIEVQRKNKIDRVQKIKELLVTDTCLTSFISDYFGQGKTEPCGKCSVCHPGKGQSKRPTFAMLRNAILNCLQQGPRSSRDITTVTEFEEVAILDALELLLKEEVIKLNQRNEYYRS